MSEMPLDDKAVSRRNNKIYLMEENPLKIEPGDLVELEFVSSFVFNEFILFSICSALLEESWCCLTSSP